MSAILDMSVLCDNDGGDMRSTHYTSTLHAHLCRRFWVRKRGRCEWLCAGNAHSCVFVFVRLLLRCSVCAVLGLNMMLLCVQSIHSYDAITHAFICYPTHTYVRNCSLTLSYHTQNTPYIIVHMGWVLIIKKTTILIWFCSVWWVRCGVCWYGVAFIIRKFDTRWSGWSYVYIVINLSCHIYSISYQNDVSSMLNIMLILKPSE